MQGDSMIQDQASRLRQWVRQYGSEGAGSRMPRLVVVLGGRPGVGATTLAMNLAAAFSATGLRSVLLDAAMGRADATRRCGLRSQETLADVVSAGRTLADILQRVPEGFYVAPGVGPGQRLIGDARYSSQRILEGLRRLGGWAEIVLADLGTGLSAWMRALWRAADCRLVVTSPEQNILMDTYATIKLLTTQVALAPIHLVVSRAVQKEAQEVYERLARTCLRFLALPVSYAGFVPVEESLAEKEEEQKLAMPWRLAGRSAEPIQQIAHYVAQLLGKRPGLVDPTCPSSPADQTDVRFASTSKAGPVRSEPAWLQASATPPHWHVYPGDWVGRVGFPVTVSPSLNRPVEENSKKV